MEMSYGTNQIDQYVRRRGNFYKYVTLSIRRNIKAKVAHKLKSVP